MDVITIRMFGRPAAQVHGTLFAPAGARPAAAVLVIGGSGGSEPSYVAEALAREGMTAMSVACFARPGLPRQLRGIRLEYDGAAPRCGLVRADQPMLSGLGFVAGLAAQAAPSSGAGREDRQERRLAGRGGISPARHRVRGAAGCSPMASPCG